MSFMDPNNVCMWTVSKPFLKIKAMLLWSKYIYQLGKFVFDPNV